MGKAADDAIRIPCVAGHTDCPNSTGPDFLFEIIDHSSVRDGFVAGAVKEQQIDIIGTKGFETRVDALAGNVNVELSMLYLR